MPAPRRARVGDHGLVGIGLDGIADQRVEAGEGLLQHAIVPLQGRGGIAIERRADLVGNAREAHVLRVEDTANVAGNGALAARQRSKGSRTEGLCGTGSPGLPGVASPLSDCTPGGFSSEPRTPQPPSRRALAKARARPHPHCSPRLHLSRSLSSTRSRSTESAGSTTPLGPETTAVLEPRQPGFSPFPPAFPIALSRLAPFCARSVALFPHNLPGSSGNFSRKAPRRRPRVMPGCISCMTSRGTLSSGTPLGLGGGHDASGDVVRLAEGQLQVCAPANPPGRWRWKTRPLPPPSWPRRWAPDPRPCRSWRQDRKPQGWPARRRSPPCPPACPWRRRAAGPS